MPSRFVGLVSWLNPLRGLRAAQGVGVLLPLLLLPGLALAQAPQATVITNTATGQFRDANGNVGTIAPATALVLVQYRLGVRVDPDREVEARPGTRILLPHTVTNVGNQADTYVVAPASPSGWPVDLYVQSEGFTGAASVGTPNGAEGGEVPAGYIPLTGTIALAAGDSVGILLVTTVPEGFGPGMTEALVVTATSTTSAAITDGATDLIRHPPDGPVEPGVGVTVRKRVDRAWAQVGDVLTYTIEFLGSAEGNPVEFVLTDSIPAGTRYVPGSLALDGRALSDAEDGDEGEFLAGVVRVRPGEVTASARGAVTFRVEVAEGTAAGASILNRAFGEWADGEGARVASDTARTRVVAPDLTLTKTVVGSTTVRVGDEVTFRIVARNASAEAVVRNLVVQDPLPAGLQLVSAVPPTGADGAWRVAELAPGDSVVFLLGARITAGEPGRAVVNRALATWDEAAAEVEAEVTLVIGADRDPELRIELTATALEVAMGESVVLLADVRNAGHDALRDVLVEIVLPRGTRYVPGSLDGAEFVSQEGDRLVVRLPGGFPPGASRRFIYGIAVVSPDADVLVNLAEATANDGAVRSNVDDAVLRLRGNRPVETHTVIGQIWLDLNLNGRPDPGEPGFADVDVWTEDGAVSRTDEQGKFSFDNLRLGTHHLRIDPATLPAGILPPPVGDGMTGIRVTGWTTPLVLLPVWTEEAVAAWRAGRGEQAPPEPVAAAAVGTTNGNGDTSASPATRVKVLVEPARSEADRAAERRSAMTLGPGVEFDGVADGLVSFWSTIFLTAVAEPNVPISLFHADTLVAEGRTRPDGIQEYLNLRLARGPNLLRARVVNSWGHERWDSLRVHVSGDPATLAVDTARLVLPADGRTRHTVRFRVYDEWGVPVVTRPHVTVGAEEVVVTTRDQSNGAGGLQVQVDDQGWAEVEFRTAARPSRGHLDLRMGDVHVRIPVDMVPPSLPFLLMGSGQVGLGAAPDAYGAVTARGRLTDATSLTLSLDSRRLDDGHDGFGRVVNPFSEGLYPVVGDAAQSRTESAARGVLSARLERGFDHLVAGDIQTTLGENQNSLARYSRSLTGAAARVGTGPLTWTGFGAMSGQALRQVQLRGLGTSGPYLIDQRVIPGTEQAHVEVRDRANAQVVLSRVPLHAFADYEIDYRNGTILLKQPLPASDAMGNPVFLVITAEAMDTGDRAPVFGARVEGDVAPLLFGGDGPARLQVGGSVVHDGQGLEPLDMVAGDVALSPVQGTEIRAEVARSSMADTTGFATHLTARSSLLAGRVVLGAGWRRTEDAFRNPSNLGLRGATEELNASGTLRLFAGEVKLTHARQEFGDLDISRQSTSLSLRQPLTGRTELETRVLADDVTGGSLPRSGSAGDVKLTWNPIDPLRVWGETRGSFGAPDTYGLASHFGGGASYQFTRDLAAEGRHLQVSGPDGEDYSVTSLGLRSRLAGGGAQAWGSYQLLGAIDGASGAALVGLSHRLTFGDGWRMNGLFERREGLDRAPIDDPLRALPFARVERDYWSTGLGLEHLPAERPYRFSLRGERKHGEAERFTLGTLAGDVSMGGSFAVLARQEYMLRQPGAAVLDGALGRTSRRSSILGLALRPEAHQDWNALVEFRWLAEQNPRGSGLLANTRDDERLIAATELIWAPRAPVELGVRYAARSMRTHLNLAGFPDAVAMSRANYLGGRGEVELRDWASVRAEARYLDERRAAGGAWDFAPSLAIHPVQGLELTAGHRWGDLRDRDFAVNGGSGFFVTLGARVTERTLPTAASFWRSRIGNGGHGETRLDPRRLPEGALPVPALPPSISGGGSGGTHEAATATGRPAGTEQSRPRERAPVAQRRSAPATQGLRLRVQPATPAEASAATEEADSPVMVAEADSVGKEPGRRIARAAPPSPASRADRGAEIAPESAASAAARADRGAEAAPHGAFSVAARGGDRPAAAAGATGASDSPMAANGDSGVPAAGAVRASESRGAATVARQERSGTDALARATPGTTPHPLESAEEARCLGIAGSSGRPRVLERLSFGPDGSVTSIPVPCPDPASDSGQSETGPPGGPGRDGGGGSRLPPGTGAAGVGRPPPTLGAPGGGGPPLGRDAQSFCAPDGHPPGRGATRGNGGAAPPGGLRTGSERRAVPPDGDPGSGERGNVRPDRGVPPSVGAGAPGSVPPAAADGDGFPAGDEVPPVGGVPGNPPMVRLRFGVDGEVQVMPADCGDAPPAAGGTPGVRPDRGASWREGADPPDVARRETPPEGAPPPDGAPATPGLGVGIRPPYILRPGDAGGVVFGPTGCGVSAPVEDPETPSIPAVSGSACDTHLFPGRDEDSRGLGPGAEHPGAEAPRSMESAGEARPAAAGFARAAAMRRQDR